MGGPRRIGRRPQVRVDHGEHLHQVRVQVGLVVWLHGLVVVLLGRLVIALAVLLRPLLGAQVVAGSSLRLARRKTCGGGGSPAGLLAHLRHCARSHRSGQADWEQVAWSVEEVGWP